MGKASQLYDVKLSTFFQVLKIKNGFATKKKKVRANSITARAGALSFSRPGERVRPSQQSIALAGTKMLGCLSTWGLGV